MADDATARLEQIRGIVREQAPDAIEVVSYGIPTFDLLGAHLVHFAAFKHHIGLFPTASGIAAFVSALAPYKYAKGSVQFPHNRPFPVDLIAQIVQFRVDAVRAAAPKRGSKRPFK